MCSRMCCLSEKMSTLLFICPSPGPEYIFDLKNFAWGAVPTHCVYFIHSTAATPDNTSVGCKSPCLAFGPKHVGLHTHATQAVQHDLLKPQLAASNAKVRGAKRENRALSLLGNKKRITYADSRYFIIL